MDTKTSIWVKCCWLWFAGLMMAGCASPQPPSITPMPTASPTVTPVPTSTLPPAVTAIPIPSSIPVATPAPAVFSSLSDFPIVINRCASARVAPSDPDHSILPISVWSHIYLWDVTTGAVDRVLYTKNLSVRTVGWPDEYPDYSQEMESDPEVQDIVWSPDGRILAALVNNWLVDKSTHGAVPGPDAVILWDVAADAILQAFKDPSFDDSRAVGQWWTVERLAFSPDGKALFTIARDTRNVWDVASGERLVENAGTHNVLSPDGTMIAVMNGTFEIVDAGTGEHLHIFEGTWPVDTEVAWSPDGARLVVTREKEDLSGATVLEVWDTAMWEQLYTREVSLFERSPDGRTFLGDGGLWNMASGTIIMDLAGHYHFSSDGTVLITDEHTADTSLLIDALTGETLLALEVPRDNHVFWIDAWWVDDTMLEVHAIFASDSTEFDLDHCGEPKSLQYGTVRWSRSEGIIEQSP